MWPDFMKSNRRLQQEKQIEEWAHKAQNLSSSTLYKEIQRINKKIKLTFKDNLDDDIIRITQIIGNLSKKGTLIFENQMGYKFSKSDSSYAELFSEKRFVNYPEYGIAYAKGDMGLSFTTIRVKLLVCACYGDQLTQIPFNASHPHFNELKENTNKYSITSNSFEEINASPLLVGKNISMKNPYVLKELILLSCQDGYYSDIDFFFKPIMCGNSRITLGKIYQEIGFDDTAHFFRDMETFKTKRNGSSDWMTDMVNDLDSILPPTKINPILQAEKEYYARCEQLLNVNKIEYTI